MKTEKRIKKNRIIAMCVAAVVLFICVSLCVKILENEKKNRAYEARRDRLQELLDDEELRQKLLDDEEAYAKTREYIEEKARSIGYVYPDDVIFKKKED